MCTNFKVNANTVIIVLIIKQFDDSFQQMSNLLERIVKTAENENISISKLEQQIGASKGVISRALANNSDIQSKWRTSLVENYPKYSIDWLISGEGEMLKGHKTIIITAC